MKNTKNTAIPSILANISKKLLIDTILFDIAPEQINESLENNSGRLIVKGKVIEQEL
jgi:hypothetical protein